MNVKPKVYTGVPVSVRLSDEMHDALILVALRRDVPLAAIMREFMALGLRHSHGVVTRVTPPKYTAH